jgi:hypothetical protein
MSTIANHAFTTTHGSTGPRTEQGKANSSRNALRTGLYTARDFVRPEEEEEYGQTLLNLMDELTPEGVLEKTFATEIMGATWRLRRCRLIEESFTTIDDLNSDPMVDEKTEKAQRSVDRARAQSHLILRRSLVELRKLQTGRTIPAQLAQSEAAPKPEASGGLAHLDALLAQADHQLAEQYRAGGLSSFCTPGVVIPPPATSFCRTPKSTPRNAPCPCRSGAKYKKCCGNPAAPAVNKAA